MRRVGAALAACICISQAEAAEFGELYAAALTMHTLDALQTMHIAESCRAGAGYYERNPILGRCPSKAEVSRYFIGTAVLLSAVHAVLPERYAKYSTGLWLVVETGTVAHNAAIGLRFKF